jgi:hypothetical protein
MNYEIKYLKYKNKYLNIKNNFLGGAEASEMRQPANCIISFKKFLNESFGLTEDEYSSLDNITLGDSKFHPTGKSSLELSPDLQEQINTYCINPIDNIFTFLRQHYTVIYKSITGPDTWEKRMVKIIELLEKYKDTISDIGLAKEECIIEHNSLVADINKLYQLLIDNIIEYNTNNIYYIQINDREIMARHPDRRDDFRMRPQLSIVPNTVLDNNILQLLITELHNIFYSSNTVTQDAIKTEYASRKSNRTVISPNFYKNETTFRGGMIISNLFRMYKRANDIPYQGFINYIYYETLDIFYQHDR